MMPQAVILAGGLGTRLKPLTDHMPKPLVPVRGRPFLEWQILDLKHQGVFHILILVSYLGEQIVDHFKEGESLGVKLDYCFEPEPLGTGGALVNALAQLEDAFILLNGDSFLHAPLKSMWDDFRSRHLGALVASYGNQPPTPVPNNLKTSAGLVRAYEKLAGLEKGFDSVDAGVYILRKSLLEGLSPQKFQLEELWPDLMTGDGLGCFPVLDRFYDIGTHDRLKLFEERLNDYFPNAL